MRKKFMLVAALAGILSLGACVDDKESASVEAIRNAKAEQLKSVAAMNNAEAEATKLLAEANAALLAIQAELDKVTLESEKAALALQLAGQEQKLEAALLEAQAALALAKQTYLDNLKAADDQETARLKSLLTAYTTAAKELIDKKHDLASEKYDLVGLKYDLVDANTAKERAIVGYKNQITQQEVLKATYEKYLNADEATAQKAYDVADSELNVLNNKADASGLALNAAGVKFTAASTLLNNSAYLEKLGALQGLNAGGMVIQPLTIDGVDYWGYVATDKFGITTDVPMFTDELTKSTDVEYIFDDQSYGGIQSYDAITDFYTVKKDGFDKYIAAFEAEIKDNEAEDVKDAQEAYDAAVAAEKVAETAAKKADATAADEAAYLAANGVTVAAKSVLDAATDALNDANAELAEVKAIYAFVTSTEQTAAVKTMVDSYNSLSKDVCDKAIQNAKDGHVAGLKSVEVAALGVILGDATVADIVGNIQACDDAIKDLERDIVDMRSVESAEELIEKCEGRIAKLEAEITAKEREVATAKAALEAATNA